MNKLLIITIITLSVIILSSCDTYDYYDEYAEMEQKLNETSGKLYDLQMDYDKLKDEKDMLEWENIDLLIQLEEYERIFKYIELQNILEE